MNMCLHKSFENMTQKVRDPLYNVINSPPLTYCDGSRNRCQGCHCRFPSYDPIVGHCEKCGRMLFDLLDVIWECRQLVYHTFADSGFGCMDFIDMEYEIEDKIWERVNLDYPIARTELIDIYRDAATEITRDVIEKKMKKLQPVCPCHRSLAGGNSPTI